MFEFSEINFSINTKGKLPSLPFGNMKVAVLGTKYDLVLNFIDAKKIQTLNRTYRHRDQPTDILSFPLSKNSGEVFICRKYADKKSVSFGRRPENYLAFLVIHGLVHLKGFEHSSRMESIEAKYRQKFGV